MTKVKDIFLTPNNVMEYQEEDVQWRIEREYLELHMEVNTALCEALCGNHDWGGRYACWLNDIGISHETDFGWWNATAVDKKNMQAFVDYWEESKEALDFIEAYDSLKNKIKELPKRVRINKIDYHVNVIDFVMGN